MLEAVAPPSRRRKRARDAPGAARGVGDPFDSHLAKWEQQTAQQQASLGDGNDNGDGTGTGTGTGTGAGAGAC